MIYPNGSVRDMHNEKFWVSSCRVHPVQFSRNTSSVDGYRGLIEIDTEISSRKIVATIQIESRDAISFDYLQSKIQAIFNPFDEFYIVRDLQPGKRYKAKVANLSVVDFEENSLEDGEFTVEFEMFMPFAESIGTSLQLQNSKESDVNLWQWSQGIDGDRVYRYQHTTNSFVINNFGNVHLDPREHELEIIVVATAASYLQIVNETTGESYRINRTLNSGDTLRIARIQTFINGVSSYRHTNKRNFGLAPGDNQFTISGGTIHSVTFNFRPLYY